MSYSNEYTQAAQDLKQYVLNYFHEHADERLVYHNLDHTTQVVDAAVQIANHYHLNDKDFFTIYAAAWFHDAGYFTDSSNHEQAGAIEAERYLLSTNTDATVIQSVKNCILATKLPQRANSLPEQIVCDADLFHFGTDTFDERSKLMRKECKFMGRDISKEQWRKDSLKLLESHTYYTDYCNLLLNKRKQENMDELKRKEEKAESKTNNETVAMHAVADNDASAKADKKNKDKRPERGIETMFRISSGNHQRLSDQADSKSHILITVNSIIISVLLSVLLKSLDEFPQLRIPAYMLLTVNLVTIICAILSTRPNIPPGTFTQNDIDEKKVNLLFFGNFYKMSLQDYAGGMMQMMEDREFLYGSLIRDVYSQGVVLGRKYRMLRLAYNIFMYGLIVSVVAFVVASLMK